MANDDTHEQYSIPEATLFAWIRRAVEDECVEFDLTLDDIPTDPVSDHMRERAAAAVRAALSANAGQTLGQYVQALRNDRNFARNEVAVHAKLAPDVIAGIEDGSWPVTAVQPSRLARVLVFLGAAKETALSMVARGITPPASPGPIAHFSLSRYEQRDRMASGSNMDGNPVQSTERNLDEYLQSLASAFDAESSRSRQA